MQHSQGFAQHGLLNQQLLAAAFQHTLRIFVHAALLLVEGGGIGADELNVGLQLVQRAVLSRPKLQTAKRSGLGA